MRESVARTGGLERLKAEQIDQNGVTELIRSAERYIASGKFSLAEEQLATAQILDPKNQYIPAILDRIKVLQKPAPQTPANVDVLAAASGEDPQRYLSVTVGKEFKSGVRAPGEQTPETPRDLQSRIRRLTNIAESYVESGSFKNAFESLMKAYLLDPMSPFVIACEKAVLPAWQNAQAPASEGSQMDMENGPEKARHNSRQEQRGEL